MRARQGEDRAVQVRRRGEWRRPLAVVAIILGLGLLAWAAALWWQSANAPPIYSYHTGEPLALEELGPLEPLVKQDITVRPARITAGSDPLVELEFAETEAGPVLLSWNALVDGPFLTMPPTSQEMADLAPVLSRHVLDDAQLLAWWDVSRQFELLSGVNATFDTHLGIPLFVPPSWPRAQAEIIEAEFWQMPEDLAGLERFQKFTHALLADEEAGMAELRALVGDQPTVLTLHVRDIILLGQLEPEKIGVAFKDFPATGDVHGMVRTAHDWLNQNDYAAYTVIRLEDQQLRVVALTDQASGTTLAARLLPFIGNNQETVAGTKLVYQTGGFWVFELTSEEAPAQLP